MAEARTTVTRTWIARAFSLVEDLVYIGLGLLLALTAIALLLSGVSALFHDISSEGVARNIVELLDRILLILLVVELLYTVEVSFREHTLAPEPFLLIGVIAAIRRVLVLTAEFGHMPLGSLEVFQRSMIELGVLTVLVLVLVVALILLRRNREVPAV